MNKNAKAAIAVGAGVILLLGGGGTLALWNSSTTAGGATIQAGQLKVDSTGASTAWYTKADWDAYEAGTIDAAALAADALDADYTIVPGDDLVLAVTGLSLTAQGGDLFYTLGLTSGTLDVADSNGTPLTGTALTNAKAAIHLTDLPVASPLGAAVADSTQYEDGTGAAVDADTTVYGVTAATATTSATFDAGIELSFDAATSGTTDQGYEYTLGTASIAVQQVIAAN